jgi:aspartate/methionine/tyrosine aminotransferase
VSRLDFTLRENALSQALAARREPYLDLTLSNPTAVGLPYEEERILRALANPSALRYLPQPRGLPAAREAVARYAGVDAERVLLTASTSEAYAWLFKLLCDAGDEVLVPQPSYPLFDYLGALESVRLTQYDLRWDGEWHLDPGALRFSPRTRAVLVVSPGNPTGAYLKKDERGALAQACAEHSCALICDEVFADYPAFPDPRRVPSVAAFEDVLSFSLSGLSKVAGLPQLKLGWCIAGGPGAPEALRRLELIADTYLSVSTPVQLAAAELLETRHGIQRALSSMLAANRSALQAARAPGAPWDVLRSEGGWRAVLSVPRSSSEEEWALRLLEAGVLVHPGYFFDFPSGAHLVVSLVQRPAEFARGARVLASVLDQPLLR